MFMAEFVIVHLSWASDPFQNDSIAKRHFYGGLKKSWNNKIGVHFFCHKTFFLSGLNTKFHVDLTGDIAVRKQNLIKNVASWIFLLLRLSMTVASLLGPDKRHIRGLQ